MSTVAAPEHPWLLPATLRGRPEPARRAPRRSVRDWIVDTHCFLFALGFLVLAFGDWQEGTEAFVLRSPFDPALMAVDVATAVPACLALWLRRRWPIGVALALMPLGLFSACGAIALLISIFTVAVHRPLLPAALITAWHVVAGAFYCYLRPDPDLSYWGNVALTTVLITTVLAWGMFVRARRQLVLSLRDRAERAEAEQQLRISQARHLERTRIAREMHDVLAHRISLLSLHAGALEFRPDAPPAEVAQAAGVIRASAHQALQDLREVIGVLREEPGDRPDRPQPTLAELPALIEECREAGMRISEQITVAAASTVPESVGRTAYRIVQEGLTNARKHAVGAAVTLTVSGAPGDGLTVEIGNRNPLGKPPAPEIPGTGTGLIGLAERVSLIGGTLDHGRGAGDDFTLSAWLPWPA